MTMRRNHYKPPAPPHLAWTTGTEASFDLPVLCGRRFWGAATDKLEQVDCKACLKIIDAARKKMETEEAQRLEEQRRSEQQAEQLAVAFNASARLSRIFRPRIGQA